MQPAAALVQRDRAVVPERRERVDVRARERQHRAGADEHRQLVERRGGAGSPVIVGFAAETGDDHGSVLDHGRDKLARKGCDVLVVNEVGADRTFGADDNTVTILRRGSDETVEVGPVSKAAVSTAVWDVVAGLL